MIKKIPFEELKSRMDRFRLKMDEISPEWRIAVIFSKINQYYFTGTMQDGMLIIPRDDEAVYWVRRSYERALDESLFPHIKHMQSFRDAAAEYTNLPKTVYMETEIVPIALYQRFLKHFKFEDVRPADRQIASIRAVKSKFELSLIEQSGKIHKRILEERLPEVIVEGMSEAELGTRLFTCLLYTSRCV